jgi:hypothetical protein
MEVYVIVGLLCGVSASAISDGRIDAFDGTTDILSPAKVRAYLRSWKSY